MNSSFLESLIPDLYNVNVKAKVLKLLISLETTQKSKLKELIYLFVNHSI
jgi:hypothetical protein